MTAPNPATYVLSDDRLTLVIKRREPDGVRVATYQRDADAGPFTDEDVSKALAFTSKHQMRAGRHDRGRRKITRFGTLWTYLSTGAPTWWLPKVLRGKDGAILVGWLRLAVVVKFERPEHNPEPQAGEPA